MAANTISFIALSIMVEGDFMTSTEFLYFPPESALENLSVKIYAHSSFPDKTSFSSTSRSAYSTNENEDSTEDRSIVFSCIVAGSSLLSK